MNKFPIFFEDSKVPIFLSNFSPIDIWGISLGFAVFCRGKLSVSGKIHETIHYRQWAELGFIGFAILYPAFWLINLCKGMSPADAYRYSPFEIEAYNNEHDLGYLFNRKLFAWARRMTE
jgi:hypothetical protein